MALDTVDKLINGLAESSQRIPIHIVPATGLGGAHTKWRIGGYPTAALTPPGAPNGEIPTKDTPGAVPFVNAAAGKQLYLAGLRAAQPTNMGILVVDRLWHCSGVSLVNTTTTLNSPTTLPRGADPLDTEFGWEGNVTAAGSNTNGTFTVVDADGNTVTLVTNGGFGTGFAANAWTMAGSSVTTSIVSGNNAFGVSGISRVTQLQIGTGYTAGSINVVIYRRIAYMNAMGGNFGYASHDGPFDTGLVAIPNDACLSFFSFNMAGSAAEGPLMAEIELIEV